MIKRIIRTFFSFFWACIYLKDRFKNKPLICDNLPSLWTGSLELRKKFLQKKFFLGEKTFKSFQTSQFKQLSPSLKKMIISFSWMTHFKPVHEHQTLSLVRGLMENWIKKHKYTFFITDSQETIFIRFLSWLSHYETFVDSAPEEFKKKIQSSLYLHCCYIVSCPIPKDPLLHIRYMHSLISVHMITGRNNDSSLFKTIIKFDQFLKNNIINNPFRLKRQTKLYILALKEIIDIRQKLNIMQLAIPAYIQSTIHCLYQWINQLIIYQGFECHLNQNFIESFPTTKDLFRYQPQPSRHGKDPFMFSRQWKKSVFMVDNKSNHLSFEFFYEREFLLFTSLSQPFSQLTVSKSPIYREQDGHSWLIQNIEANDGKNNFSCQRNFYLDESGHEIRIHDQWSQSSNSKLFHLIFYLHPSIINYAKMKNQNTILIDAKKRGRWLFRCNQTTLQIRSFPINQSFSQYKSCLTILIPIQISQNRDYHWRCSLKKAI